MRAFSAPADIDSGPQDMRPAPPPPRHAGFARTLYPRRDQRKRKNCNRRLRKKIAAAMSPVKETTPYQKKKVIISSPFLAIAQTQRLHELFPMLQRMRTRPLLLAFRLASGMLVPAGKRLRVAYCCAKALSSALTRLAVSPRHLLALARK